MKSSLWFRLVVLLIFFMQAADSRLRNRDESTSCENESEFECEFGICIPDKLTCNSEYDCLSLADESVQTCGCPIGEFQCRNSCIPIELRCNRQCDCQDDCTDEEHCDSFECIPGYQKCDNHYCVSIVTWCDFVDDCGDNSDETVCFRKPCWANQFRCNNSQCINSFYICDGYLDCLDGSDEDQCDDANFVDCGDGRRVFKHAFCDGHVDCPLNEADETANCGSCNATTQYECANTKCITKAKVCNKWCDCLDCDDEENCEECTPEDHIYCPSFDNKPPTCLRQEYICDGNGDCDQYYNMADELGCALGESSPIDCTDGYECGSRDQRCLPLDSSLCALNIHCLADNHKYRICSNVSIECPSDQFQCRNQVGCVSMAKRCNKILDCNDGSDEENCELIPCPPDKWKCAGGHCVSNDSRCDHHRDCHYYKGRKDESDETNCTFPACQDSEFRCHSGQCIEGWRRCYKNESINGSKFGCIDDSHLLNCSDAVCPPDAFKCRNSYCLDPSLRCNQHVDCLESWDDETDPTCSQGCLADGCECTGNRQVCVNLGLTINMLDLSHREIEGIIHFNLSGNYLSVLLTDESSLVGLNRMVSLDLSNNSITDIKPQALFNIPRLHSLILCDNNITILKSNTFSLMFKLKYLKLNGNQIHTIEEKAFFGLRDLSTLDLSGQNLSSIYNRAFEGLHSLSFLNLSNNHLKDIPQGAFFGLNELTVLDISNNELETINEKAFFGLPKLRVLHTDEYRFCCMAKSVDTCTPDADEFSSCEDLMANLFLRCSIWIIGIIASIGNLVVILMRMKNKRDNRVHSFLITNLAIGDFCMGVYLLIIAAVDAHYRGRYIIFDNEWRQSVLCNFAGFLSLFSSELSVFSLTIITLHRLFSILFPFRIKDMEFSGAVRIMIVAWIIVILLAGFPLVNIPYFGNFYGRSGVCLALPITKAYPPGWEYSVFIFLVLNLVSFGLIALSYSAMFVVARRTQKAVMRSRDAKSGDAMARRMTIIVMTDFLCWMPIVFLGIASLAGANIPPQVFAWIAVFVLPINSAINPMLYTLLTAPYVRRVMTRARTSLNLSLATMTTDMKQVNQPGDRRQSNGRSGWKKASRTPQADPNKNAIKLNTMISFQSDTEPDEAAKMEEFTPLRDTKGMADEETAFRITTGGQLGEN